MLRLYNQTAALLVEFECIQYQTWKDDVSKLDHSKSPVSCKMLALFVIGHLGTFSALGDSPKSYSVGASP